MSTEPWRDAPDLLDLPSGTLDVWRAEIASRAGARTVLRVLLGRYLRHRPDTIEFAVGPHGKPALAGDGVPPLHFNMSHTRGLALYAVARDIQVGADIERPRPGIDTVRLARRFITPGRRTGSRRSRRRSARLRSCEPGCDTRRRSNASAQASEAPSFGRSRRASGRGWRSSIPATARRRRSRPAFPHRPCAAGAGGARRRATMRQRNPRARPRKVVRTSDAEP